MHNVILVMATLLSLFGLQVIGSGLKIFFSPIPNLELAPYMLLTSGTLFLITGLNLPRLLKK